MTILKQTITSLISFCSVREKRRNFVLFCVMSAWNQYWLVPGFIVCRSSVHVISKLFVNYYSFINIALCMKQISCFVRFWKRSICWYSGTTCLSGACVKNSLLSMVSGLVLIMSCLFYIIIIIIGFWFLFFYAPD